MQLLAETGAAGGKGLGCGGQIVEAVALGTPWRWGAFRLGETGQLSPEMGQLSPETGQLSGRTQWEQGNRGGMLTVPHPAPQIQGRLPMLPGKPPQELAGGQLSGRGKVMRAGSQPGLTPSDARLAHPKTLEQTWAPLRPMAQ